VLLLVSVLTCRGHQWHGAECFFTWRH